MKKENVKFKRIGSILLVLAIVGSLMACSSKNNTVNSKKSTKTVKILAATSAAPAPFTYKDKNDKLTGYDITIAKAVFDKIPGYKLDFEVTDFGSIFTGIDSGIYQMGINNLSYNKERAAKYIYTTPIFKDQYVIAVAADNNNIKSFNDILGKSTEIDPATNYAAALQKFNEKNKSNPVKISYSETDLVEILRHVESGNYGFQLIDGPMLDVYMKEYHLKLKKIILTDEEQRQISDPYSYFVFSKDQKELADKVSKVLAGLVKDGTIKKIGIQFFGNDYSPYDKY